MHRNVNGRLDVSVLLTKLERNCRKEINFWYLFNEILIKIGFVDLNHVIKLL